MEATFDGGKLTSDGGLIWLAETDNELGLCEEIASHVPEWRKAPSVRHSLKTLVRQRVLQIACGYEDQNDSDTLRRDPLLKLVCGKLPETDTGLASQPIISRLENAPDGRACLRIEPDQGLLALKADRLSCHRFFANQFRLLLHAAAYWLLDALRRKLVEAGVRRMQLDTLRLLVVMIGGRVRQLLTKVRLHLASGHPGQRLWHMLSLADSELAHE